MRKKINFIRSLISRAKLQRKLWNNRSYETYAKTNLNVKSVNLVRLPKAASLFFKVWLLNMASAMFSYRDFREKGPWFESYLLGIEKHSFDNLRLLLEKGHKLYLKIWFYGLHRQPSTRMICPTSLRMALLPCLLMIQPYTVLQLLDGTLCYLKTKSDYHSGCMSKNRH